MNATRNGTNMRQGPSGRRPQRNRHQNGGHSGGNGGGNSTHANHSSGNMGGNRPRSAASLRHQSFDSNCGDLRVRGNAWQVHEKYQALARDATSAGDRVSAENFMQHAEHYFRIIGAIEEATVAEQQQRGVQPSAPYGQQPEMPRNYYGADGNAALPADAEGTPAQPGQQPQTEATVQQRNPPPTSFFTPEEIEEHQGEQPLTGTR